MSNYQSSRSTRTYQYSSSGPGGQGTRVTETRIVGGPGGTKTETKTYYSGAPADGSIGFSGFGPGAGGSSGGFSSHGNFNIRSGGASDGFGIPANFGDMSIANGGQKFTITPRRNVPDESRYKKGWGSSRGSRPPPGPPMKLEGKTYAEIKAQCLREGRLFEDPDFPAVDTSIFYSRAPPRPFVWKRPGVSTNSILLHTSLYLTLQTSVT